MGMGYQYESGMRPIQPFEDFNKRVSRLAANIPLIHHDLCPLSFMDVPEDLYVNGLLGIYELNRIELMRDVFVWTYERSCNRYQVIPHTLGEPDTFRLRYRKALIDCVGEAIRQVGQGKIDDTGEVLTDLAEDLVPEDDLLEGRVVSPLEPEHQLLAPD